MARKDNRSSNVNSTTARNAAIGAGAVIATLGAAAFVAKRAKGDKGDDALISDAPKWTLRDRPEGDKGALIGRSTTINLPRQEVYRGGATLRVSPISWTMSEASRSRRQFQH